MLGRIWRRRAPPHRCSDAPEDPRLARAEEAIAGLPELTRKVFFMHRLENLSYERIARRLDIDAKEVEGHIAATLIVLRHALKEFD
ncbi:sigma factor-like helix-turn-helix DNA-binding protein [Sphingopyxis chilensis]